MRWQGFVAAVFFFALAGHGGDVHFHAIEIAQGGNVLDIFGHLVAVVQNAFFGGSRFGDGFFADVFKSIHFNAANHPGPVRVHFNRRRFFRARVRKRKKRRKRDCGQAFELRNTASP